VEFAMVFATRKDQIVSSSAIVLHIQENEILAKIPTSDN